MEISKLKVALVHDYLKEYGGAERVLLALTEIFPEAPIYMAFLTPNSTAQKVFSNSKIITSWANLLLRHKNLHSPLRFLIPLIWESFDFSKFDLVILSSSGYVTKPIRIPKNVKVICYCHTPPRFLYGLQTSMEWQRYPLIKIYGMLLGHFLRLYDYLGAERVDQFIANSQTVQARITKFYRRESVVINPPVEVGRITECVSRITDDDKGKYFLIVSRIVGGKGIPMAMEAFNQFKKETKYKNYKLKIAGEFAGLRWEDQSINSLRNDQIEFLGFVTDEEKYRLMAGCEAFIVLEKDVDFGMTPVEAMAAGVPVVAFKSGGYLETVVEGKTGTFFEDYTASSLTQALQRIITMKISPRDCQKQAEKFSKEKFVQEIKKLL